MASEIVHEHMDQDVPQQAGSMTESATDDQSVIHSGDDEDNEDSEDSRIDIDRASVEISHTDDDTSDDQTGIESEILLPSATPRVEDFIVEKIGELIKEVRDTYFMTYDDASDYVAEGVLISTRSVDHLINLPLHNGQVTYLGNPIGRQVMGRAEDTEGYRVGPRGFVLDNNDAIIGKVIPVCGAALEAFIERGPAMP